jgi:hypothetical protein
MKPIQKEHYMLASKTEEKEKQDEPIVALVVLDKTHNFELLMRYIPLKNDRKMLLNIALKLEYELIANDLHDVQEFMKDIELFDLGDNNNNHKFNINKQVDKNVKGGALYTIELKDDPSIFFGRSTCKKILGQYDKALHGVVFKRIFESNTYITEDMWMAGLIEAGYY